MVKKSSDQQSEVGQDLLIKDDQIKNEEEIEMDETKSDLQSACEENSDRKEMQHEEEKENADQAKETSSVKETAEMKEFDSSEFETIGIKASTCNFGKPGAMSIVSSAKNGKRVTFSKESMNKIGNPTAINIAISKNKIAFSAAVPGSSNSLKLGRIGSKGVIYSSELVKILIEKYNLDFSGRVSITFDKVEYKVNGDKVVAEITMM